MDWKHAVIRSMIFSLALACGDDDGPSTDQSQPGVGVWDARAPLLSARQEMPSVVIEGRNHPGVSAIGGQVIVTGGYTSAGPPSAAVFAFNAATRTWTSRRAMPAPRAAHVSVEYAGKLYAIGRVTAGSVVGTNEVYDPATDNWASLAPMPTPREHLAAAVIGDRIFVAGGRAPGNFATLEAYSPAKNTWQRLADMPTARGGLGVAASYAAARLRAAPRATGAA